MEKYNKLVRDKIIEIIQANGENPIYRRLDDEEYFIELIKKDKEELEEVVNATKEEVKEELADKLEVLIAMAKYYDYTLDEIIEESNKKRNKRGGFEERLFLEKVI